MRRKGVWTSLAASRHMCEFMSGPCPGVCACRCTRLCTCPCACVHRCTRPYTPVRVPTRMPARIAITHAYTHCLHAFPPNCLLPWRAATQLQRGVPARKRWPRKKKNGRGPSRRQVDKQQKIARVGPHMTVAEAANVMLGLKVWFRAAMPAQCMI